MTKLRNKIIGRHLTPNHFLGATAKMALGVCVHGLQYVCVHYYYC